MTVYIVDIPGFPRMDISLPDLFRIAGVPIDCRGLLLLRQAHKTVGENFSTTPVFSASHKLITSGPYGVVLHPLYIAYVMLFSASFLLSGNWVIVLLMTVRGRREEMLFEKRFGPEYIAYKENTGAFLPNFRTAFGKQQAPGGAPWQ